MNAVRSRFSSAPLRRGSLRSLSRRFRAPSASEREIVFERVVRQAQVAATAPFQPNESVLPEVLRKLNYDTYRDITFRRERALWHDSDEPFEVQFFPPGYLFDHPLTINEVADGKVRAVPFSRNIFRFPIFRPRNSPGRRCETRFRRFSLLYPLNRPGRSDEVISVIGTRLFRALGKGQVYGISARGLAIDTGEKMTEEDSRFPGIIGFADPRRKRER